MSLNHQYCYQWHEVCISRQRQMVKLKQYINNNAHQSSNEDDFDRIEKRKWLSSRHNGRPTMKYREHQAGEGPISGNSVMMVLWFNFTMWIKWNLRSSSYHAENRHHRPRVKRLSTRNSSITVAKTNIIMFEDLNDAAAVVMAIPVKVNAQKRARRHYHRDVNIYRPAIIPLAVTRGSRSSASCL